MIPSFKILFALLVAASPGIATAQECTPEEFDEVRRFAGVVKRDLKEGSDWSLERLSKEAKNCGKDLDFFIPAAERTALTAEGDQAYLKSMMKELALSEDPSRDGSRFDRARELAQKYGMKKELAQIESMRVDATAKGSLKKQNLDKNFIETCKANPKNHTDALKLGPPRDQDSVGWCYAFVGADLMTAHLGQPVSAFDMALGYNSAKYKNSVNAQANCDFPAEDRRSASSGGYISTAMREASETGFCMEKDLPSFVNGASTSLKDVYFLACELADKTYDEQTRCEAHGFAKDYFPNVDSKLWAQTFKEAVGNPELALKSLREKSCPKRMKADVKIRNVFYPNINFNPEHEIQKSVMNGSIVGISVKLDDIMIKSKDAYHAMTVVGQEYNEETQSCDFVVRNSWGTSCGGFDLRKVTCNAGVLKIPSKTLASILTDTTEVEK